MYKVMIVDDEEVIVRGLVQLLPWSKYDCKVIATASSGKEALSLAEQDPPDILFTDINMPEIDGLALIACLRSQYPHTQVTILSGYSEFEFAQKAIRMGVCRYLLKPSKFDQLEEALGAMIERLKHTQEVPAVDPDAKLDSIPSDGESADENALETSHNFIIRNAMQYIEDHYNEKITLQDVADNVYVSQWHLSKLISKNTNQSFSDIINSVRIKKAKELLRDPALKIWEISEMVGFSDASHFSRIFKKYENISANEYRSQITG